MTRRRFLLLATLIILLGAALRFQTITLYPPGLHYDEAANGIIASEIAFEGWRPVFIPSYTGKEVVWFYAAALLTRLIGRSIFALRITSAFWGIITIAAGGWVVRRLYPDDKRRDWLALLTMAILSVSFWHVIMSRLAFRAITQPLFQALSIGFLWWGLYRSKERPIAWLWLVLGGIFTGLTAYTYLAARLFPLPLLVAALILLIFSRERLRSLFQFGVYGLSSLLSFAPLGIYFALNPDSFFTRIDQVAAETPAEFWEGWDWALRIFFLRGDPLLRFNIPVKPVFDPILGVLFLLGFLIVLFEALGKRSALQRARAALLIVWPLVMLAPSALAVQGIPPSNLRAIGLLPLLMVYPALGITTLAGWLKKVNVSQQATGALCTAALLLIGGAGTYAIYRDINFWGQEPRLHFQNDGHVGAMAQYLNETDLSNSTVYIATFHHQHPTFAFLATEYGQTRSLFKGDALVVPPQGNSLTLYARDTQPPDDWLEMLNPYLVANPTGPDGEPDFTAYRIPAGFDAGFTPVESGNFANVIELVGAELYPTRSGNEATIDLAFEVINLAPEPDYIIVAQVCDAWGWCWDKATLTGELERAQSEAYNSSQWRPGELILLRLYAPLPYGMPPGEYAVRVGVYSRGTGESLSVIDPVTGRGGGTTTVAGSFWVLRSQHVPVNEIPIQQQRDQQLAPGINLIGYDLAVRSYRPGESLLLALYWETEGAPAESLPVKLYLDDGTVLYEDDPVAGTHPFSEWLTGEMTIDRHFGRLPVNLASGSYKLRLQLGGGSPVNLGTIQIEGIPRNYEPPTDVTYLAAPVLLGDQTMLLAYDLPAGATASETLPVKLVWQAQQHLLTDYTVFVHFTDVNKGIVSQVDRPPMLGDNLYQTSLWLSGEIVNDSYMLTLPEDLLPGVYTIRVGMYHADNGQRLSIPDTPDDVFELPQPISVR